ncbi:MAG: hypothetical protein IJL76_01875 [Bacilli bacterium]|nr:hypothetical protein [Bacilli bacterium]
MQTIKKAPLLIILILITFIIVPQAKAYSNVEKEDFLNVFSEDKFNVSYKDDSILAIRKKDPEKIIIDDYEYLEYKDSNIARNQIINVYDTNQKDTDLNLELEKDYDITEDKNSNYSILKYSYTVKEVKYYYSLYRYNNIIITGHSYYTDKDEVDKNIDYLAKLHDKKKKDVPKETTTKSMDAYTYTSIVIFIVLLIALIVLLIKGKYPNKKEVS